MCSSSNWRHKRQIELIAANMGEPSFVLLPLLYNHHQSMRLSLMHWIINLVRLHSHEFDICWIFHCSCLEYRVSTFSNVIIIFHFQYRTDETCNFVQFDEVSFQVNIGIDSFRHFESRTESTVKNFCTENSSCMFSVLSGCLFAKMKEWVKMWKRKWKKTCKTENEKRSNMMKNCTVERALGVLHCRHELHNRKIGGGEPLGRLHAYKFTRITLLWCSWIENVKMFSIFSPEPWKMYIFSS